MHGGMKNFLRLVLIVGLLVAGWMNRHLLTGKTEKVDAEAAEEIATPAAPSPAPVAGVPTPHPATAARAAAVQTYPALKIPDSAFNKRFRSLYEEAQSRDPQFLADPNWPIKLAERTAVALGGGALPVANTPPPVKPSGLQGSALDKRPAH